MFAAANLLWLRGHGLLLNDNVKKSADGFAGRLDGKPFEQFGYRVERSLLISEYLNLIFEGNERRETRWRRRPKIFCDGVQRIANFFLVGCRAVVHGM